MGQLSAGTVALSSFPFSNQASTKVRPCLVLGTADYNDIIVCQITSKAYSSRNAVALRKSDFSEGTIVVNSFIRPDKIATLDRSLVSPALGILSASKLAEVRSRLLKVLELQ